eukprot:1161959-Pelagomonas_calceolata.AAC.5
MANRLFCQRAWIEPSLGIKFYLVACSPLRCSVGPRLPELKDFLRTGSREVTYADVKRPGAGWVVEAEASSTKSGGKKCTWA